MRTPRSLETVYLGLAIAGAALPLAAVLPWLADHGFDGGLFVQELFASRVSAFFAWDVIVSAIVVLVAAAANRDRMSAARRGAVMAGTLLVGVSLALPLLCSFHERSRGEAAQ